MKTLLLITLAMSVKFASAQVKTYDTLPNLPDHYNKRCDLFKSQKSMPGRVIMVGNSITEGANWKSLLQDSTILNRGISGDVTFGVLHRLPEIIERQPSKVFLLIGINDLSRNTPDEVIVANIILTVLKIKNALPNTQVFVQSILPTNDNFKNLNKNFVGKGGHIRKINSELSLYASQVNYTYVDLHTHFIDANGSMEAKYASDGLHLSAEGYQHWVEVLKKGNYL